ncbi:g8309 [Coccomyxa elongata]
MLRVKALRSAELREGQRITKELHGRPVTVIRHSGKLYALDAKCYHMGGPLGEEGDIEDIGSGASGAACITCPWHNHKISLESGGRIDTDLCGELCTSAPKQRVHQVIDDSEHLWVLLNMEGERPSDKYNVSSNGGGLMFGNGFTSGYGLGASAFGNSTGLASSEARGLGSVRPAADQQTAPTALPAQGFLIPYGGVDKYYPPPSPVKPSNGTLPFRGVRTNMRGAAAREAVKNNYRPPPSSIGGAEERPSAQRKITELFSRQMPAPERQWEPLAASGVAIHTGVQDMEF